MKKIYLIVVMIGSLFIFPPITSAAEPINIVVQNKQIETDTPLLIEKGRVLIPIRAVAESLGASVRWEPKTGTATVSKWSKDIHLTVGKKTVYVEGNHVPLQSNNNTTAEISIDSPVANVNNRVYIPLRIVSELLGHEVHWANNTVFINSPKNKWEDYFHGNLSDAREIAMSIPSSPYLQSENKPLDVHFTTNKESYLFAEGEALQFYYTFGDTISFIQFKNDFPVVTWQAHFQGADPLKAFVDGNFTEQSGTIPAPINKRYLYYSSGISGVSSTVQSGYIDIDGNILETGYKRMIENVVTDERGTVSLTMPDE